MLRETLDPAARKRFRTGRPCLDFVHTGGVGRWVAAELIHDGADAGFWLALVLDLDGVRASAADVEPLRTLREALWQLAQATIAGRAFAAEHVRVVNAAAAAPPPRIEMTSGGALVTAPVDASQALSALARDAIDLFTGPLRGRVRECAAADCQLLFVDASRPGRRRWCSMERCGSLAKMRRYRAPGPGS
jgi:predicted RNA-binding Zn ribbon-like protein